VVVLNLENNLKNAEFFRRYVIGARFNRGKNIPNRNIINFSFDKEPKIKVIADIQGSGNSRYVINIIEDQSGFKVIHDCPDFKKGTKFCKHIVKILLLIDIDTCKSICQNYRAINFSSNFSLVKESKTESYILKADDLINQAKYFEAINFLEHAYEESKNFSYIKKATEISFKFKLYDQVINFSVQFNDLVNTYRKEYPRIISNIISKLHQYNFSKKVEIINNIQKLLNNFSKDLLAETLKLSDIQEINELVLKYLLLHKLDLNSIGVDYFKDVTINSKSSLKSIVEQKTLELTNEAILNMESEEEINSFLIIAKICNFTNHNEIFAIVQEYKIKIRDIYKEALKLKHAFLRSLVITNTNTDKLKEMKFTERYNYPTLIWTRPLRNETPLHYYLLEKCGFEKHHLEYIKRNDFVENYPVFKEIFNGNNPIRYEIKDYWGIDNPRISNTVRNDSMVELDFKLDVKDLSNFLLVEWDLAQIPILGSYICQFSDGYIIPDKNHPLTHEIQPFNLILCNKKPIAIKGNNIKIFRPIRRINTETAIELVWRGIDFLSSYLPLNIIQDLKNFVIDEFDAYNKIEDFFKSSFLPNEVSNRKAFQFFIQNKVLSELNKTYLKLSEKPENSQKILRMIGFKRYSKIFSKRTALQSFKLGNLKRESLQELKLDFKKFVSKKLTEIIQNKEYESINIRTLRSFPTFRKWTVKVILELKKQLESITIYEIAKKKYDVQNLLKNYYGRIIVKEIIDYESNNKGKSKDSAIEVSENELSEIIENFKFLKLNEPKIAKKIA
jgi:hypothetical protein